MRERTGVASRGLVLAFLIAAACAPIGPRSITHDRFDYATSISESWKAQVLGNMVRIRYLEPPVFLDIESAIASYALDASANAGTSIYPSQGSLSSFTVGVGATYTERPTITYNPLVGERFNKSMMTPIPPEELLALIQAGWSAELLLRSCVHSINGLHNHEQAVHAHREPDPRFTRLLELVGRIQRGGGMGMRVLKSKDTTETLVFFSAPNPTGQLAEDIAEVEKLLGVDPDAHEFKAIFGLAPRDHQEIALLTRSVLEILLELSSYIQVPPEDVVEHRAAPGFDDSRAEGLAPLIRVRSGVSKPPDAFAAIQYRGHWFWIEDRDLSSKASFSFLLFLFTLSETGGRQLSPLLTVPAG
jgi:hypothetical protein